MIAPKSWSNCIGSVISVCRMPAAMRATCKRMKMNQSEKAVRVCMNIVRPMTMK